MSDHTDIIAAMPPVAVVTAGINGLTIENWVQVATGVYVVVLVMYKLWHWHYEWRLRVKREAEEERKVRKNDN